MQVVMEIVKPHYDIESDIDISQSYSLNTWAMSMFSCAHTYIPVSRFRWPCGYKKCSYSAEHKIYPAHLC